MRVYADYAATAPLRACAKEAMLEALEDIGNPSSLHAEGRWAAERMEKARREMAELLNCWAEEIFFTSGGTESNNWAISSAVGGKAVASAMEHPSVLEPLAAYLGAWNERVRPDAGGLIDPENVGRMVNFETKLVTVMTANNEIGTIQPIQEIGEAVRKRGSAVFHTDAVQAVGHIPMDVQKMSVDMLSLSAHKFGGPKGVGALYCRRGTKPYPLLFGGGQESGRRSGTENVAGIVGMCAALREAQENLEGESEHLAILRDRLAEKIQAIPGARINGSMAHRLPGNLNCTFRGVEGEALVLMLDQAGICVSSGSACAAGKREASHVLKAIGQSEKEAQEAIRISLGWGNTMDEVEYIARTIECVVEQMRRAALGIKWAHVLEHPSGMRIGET